MNSFGHKYVGEWRNGNRHGYGIYKWAYGQYFIGKWKDNEEWEGVAFFGSGEVDRTYSYGTECGRCTPSSRQRAIVNEIQSGQILALALQIESHFDKYDSTPEPTFRNRPSEANLRNRTPKPTPGNRPSETDARSRSPHRESALRDRPTGSTHEVDPRKPNVQHKTLCNKINTDTRRAPRSGQNRE